MLALDHAGNHGMDAVEQATRIDVEHAVPFPRILGSDAAQQHHPGVVDDRIHRAEAVAAGLGTAIVPESLAAEHRGVHVEALPQLDLRRRIGLCYSAQALALVGVAQLRDALDSAAS